MSLRFIHLVAWIGTAVKVQKTMEWINYLCNNQQCFINFSMVGDSCTFIPNNTALHGSVSKAIAGLEALSKENFGVTHPLEWSAIELFLANRRVFRS